jgi:hypothetical protein
VVIDGRVYDVTPYLKDHPGGAYTLLVWELSYGMPGLISRHLACIGTVL